MNALKNISSNAWDSSICFIILTTAAMLNTILLLETLDGNPAEEPTLAFLIICVNIAMGMVSVYGFTATTEIADTTKRLTNLIYSADLEN
jgi:hypothetical protein